MMDYSLPIAKRTRQGRALIYEEYHEKKKKEKRKDNNGVDSVTPSVPSRGNRKKLAEMVQGISRSERLGANCKMKTQSETVSMPGRSEEASVEEIRVNDCAEEGSESMNLVGRESQGLKNKECSKMEFEGMDNVDEIMVDDSEEDVVFLAEGVGLDCVNSNSSRLTLGLLRDEGVVCIDADDETDLSVKHVNESGVLNYNGVRDSDEMISSLKGKVESSCLIFNDRDSKGTAARTRSRFRLLKRNENEDGGDDAASAFSKRNNDKDVGDNVLSDWLRRNVDEDGGDEFILETSLESSSSEDDNDNDDYEAEQLQSCGGSKKFSSNSSSQEDEEEEVAAESKNMNRGRKKRGRPKRVDAGVKMRRYGLDFVVYSDRYIDVNNHEEGSVNVLHDYVAKRTRSHFISKWRKKKMKLGTFSHPLCVDEEEIESSSGHDDSNEGGDDAYENEDDFSDDEAYHAGKKTVSTRSKYKSDKGNRGERVQSTKRMPTKCKGIRWEKSCNVMKILIDSILDKEEVRLEELASSGDEACKDESNPSVAETYLPLKFTFGIEESNSPKKSEDDKKMDELWAELELALRASEIGSIDSVKVENEDALPPEDDVDSATLCHLGNHQIILDEQVGFRCAFCSYVKMEIKYILPSFSTHPCGKSDWRDSGGAMNHSIFDELGSQDSLCDSYHDCGSREHAEGTVWDIIPGIKSSMYSHQRDGFEFIWKNIAGGIYLDELKNQTTFSGGNGCIISHAPGTGKTRLTVVFLQAYMSLNPGCRPLVIAPCSMLLTWEEEFQKWKFNIPFHNLNKPELSGKESKFADYIVRQVGHLEKTDIRILKLYSWKTDRSILGMSYKLFVKLTGERKGELKVSKQHAHLRKILLELPGIVVLDEGHIPRNSDSHILQALSNIKTEKRVILSGTPFQNNFDELYNTLCLARPKFANIRHRWGSLTSSITKATDDRLKCEKLKKVRDMIEPFVHVHKGSILQEKLPGLRDSVVILKPAQLQKSLFDELSHYAKGNHFKFEHYESLISVHPSILLKCGGKEFPSDRDKLGGLNPEAGVKTKFLMELIQLSEAMSEKVLVFSQYLRPLTFVMNQLKSHFNWTEGNEVLYINGKNDAKERQSSINVFNDPSSNIRVLLASTRACSEGINLVGASRVVLLDVVWNPSVERQAISRAHRLGQEKVVYVYHLIVFGTKEEKKYYRQVEKDLLSELVFSSSDMSDDQQKLSPSDLQDKILEEMVQHEKLKHMFEKIAYQHKESKLIETFTLLEKRSVISSSSS
ncbi:hypothetical protein I3760_11G083300 [Carya illinoinensis]|uniref:Uncharacterized protein n=2 Tax=Carya illinoinensis TaxID=32201 RepID=A0A922IZQ0_CARIL|nr:hypothetical protein I3760_11G083300 [Carya illinoinensis]KAG6687668.1 hypothetical protein I3842_11G084600 [Carya illinoinensis]